MQGNHFDIGGYAPKATGKRPSTQDKAKCAFYRMNVGDAPISTTPMAHAETPSPLSRVCVFRARAAYALPRRRA